MKEKQTIKQLFTEEIPLPKIVQKKKDDAFDCIRGGVSASRLSPQGSRVKFSAAPERHGKNRTKLSLPRAAAIVLACLIVTGSTSAAAVGLMTRRDRLKNLDQTEITELTHDVKIGSGQLYKTSRALTEQEEIKLLQLQSGYERNEVFPEGKLARLQEGEPYSGDMVCLLLTAAGEANILCLPDRDLTDEELLEIIEYGYQSMYALYENKKNTDLEKNNWESRLSAMTDEEVDYYYLALCSGCLEISDGYVRGGSDYGAPCLTEAESSRYQTLEAAYKQENLFPAEALLLIEQPDEYTGTGVAICRYDGMFYLPENELSDEELLEIIDFREKAYYAGNRINYEISMGYRSGYPALTSP